MKLNSRKALTLIELLLTVTILSIGIILVLKSFMTVLNALNYSQDKIEAIMFMDNKVGELREAAFKKESLEEQELEGEVNLNARNFHWQVEITPISDAEEAEIEGIEEVAVLMDWQEANKTKEQKLMTYIKIRD